MRECPNKQKCPLFPLFSLRASLKTWQIRYCDADYAQCVRYTMSQKGRKPADNLLPSGMILKSYVSPTVE